MTASLILMYHSIAESSSDPYSVSPQAFRGQLGALRAHGFEIVPLSELLPTLGAGVSRSVGKRVALTFDDGYRDFARQALPILRKQSAPATVFLVTGMLGQLSSWSRSGARERLMSEKEVRCIKAQGISLGSHSASHAPLPLLGPEELRRQLERSRAALAELGESFHPFSYPWGEWTAREARAVRDAGYHCALAVGEGTELTAANLYSLPRIAMRRDLDLKGFQALLARTPLELGLRRGYRKLRATLASLARVAGRRCAPGAG